SDLFRNRQQTWIVGLKSVPVSGHGTGAHLATIIKETAVLLHPRRGPRTKRGVPDGCYPAPEDLPLAKRELTRATPFQGVALIACIRAEPRKSFPSALLIFHAEFAEPIAQGVPR